MDAIFQIGIIYVLKNVPILFFQIVTPVIDIIHVFPRSEKSVYFMYFFLNLHRMIKENVLESTKCIMSTILGKIN